MNKKNQISNNSVTKDSLLKSVLKKTRCAGKKILCAISAVYAAAWLALSTGIIAHAEGDTSAVTKPLENLKTLVLAVIGAIGIIILAKNVMEFAQAYQAQDSATMNSALKGIVAGIIMAGIATVLTFLGF